ncbi:hypothetical protein KEU06_07215 [Pseudaminobacter sp. 19-2017]|uniref:DUF5615 domain-containing protein n=1 Tax=Pseudaminobacter soli (ex Zhang et al. 2022) TaxID=2831468 RepID=A0A942E4M5_9HYPH|nr:hypothetical protein [Pseudaminobacter soli]MBS3648417.1 hypothetical protein [Pseudaminobacter soli]
MIAQLDESVPTRLGRALAAIGCRAIRFPNEWKGLKNGRLLNKLNESGIECLVTCDRNLQYQQNLERYGIALVVLPRQRFEDLLPLLGEIASAIANIRPGQVVVIADQGKV